MSEYLIHEQVIHKIKDTVQPIFCKYNRNKLNNTDFTIISNNCWGGKCYEHYGLIKQSPTIGMYFFADDYVRFLLNLEKYLSVDLQIISADKSKYYNELERRGQLAVPIGVLNDIEIIFLHYRDPEIVLDKWKRRVQRINWKNIIYKFSYMNGCTDSLLKEYEKFVVDKKAFVFVPKRYQQYKNAIVIPDKNGEIINDTFYWNKYFDVTRFINEDKIVLAYKHKHNYE